MENGVVQTKKGEYAKRYKNTKDDNASPYA
jgi:hypothetical protein